MLVADVIRCWGRILQGYRPELTVEVTRQCPLRCPGCYAYADGHLGGGRVALRSIDEFKGRELVDGVLRLVRLHRPLHVTLVGGEPLVRHAELDELLPRLMDLGVHVQVVTSAVRPIPDSWKRAPRLTTSVSVDGLPPEHDARRKPATYDRLIRHIDGHSVTIHCTVTRQHVQREGYIEDFVRFWSEQRCAKRIWMSLYTPQLGEVSAERLTVEERGGVVKELLRLRPLYPKLDMGPIVLGQLANPPASPRECAFAGLSTCFSPDLRTKVTPCQLGGAPDCSQCGCMAAAGIGAVAHYKLFGMIPLNVLVKGSEAVGAIPGRLRARRQSGPTARAAAERTSDGYSRSAASRTS